MMTEAEYLEYDRTHDGKHEYVNGEVVAMSGVSDAHDRVQVNYDRRPREPVPRRSVSRSRCRSAGSAR